MVVPFLVRMFLVGHLNTYQTAGVRPGTTTSTSTRLGTTSAGCPVGLFEAASNQLLCPCHQSTFDVLHGATPIFGPAAARLPQLPLVVGLDGVVYATGGFSDPPGPSFWNRST